MNQLKLKAIIFLNLSVFALGNAGLYLVLRDGTRFDLLSVVMSSAVFTVLHIFISMGLSIFYRVKFYTSAEGRGWFWSTILVSMFGIGYFVFLAYIS